MSNTAPTWFDKFDKRPKTYVALLLFIYMLLNNTINATSDWMEATRNGNTPSFSMWEPFVWEYSSALSTLMLLPLAFYWFSCFPLRFHSPVKQLAVHFLASLIYCVAHVVLMVAGREFVYALAGGNYNFGDVLREFIYEYRKDVWAYMFWMLLYYAYRFIYSRLKGEASLLDSDEDTQTDASGSEKPVPEHLLVKKLDKEYLVKVEDIEWLESAGNYVNLHSDGRIYPLRSTMADILGRLESGGFSRIHRSYGVNLQQIASIAQLPSGDAEVTLKNGKVLSLSRRYKDSFRQMVS